MLATNATRITIKALKRREYNDGNTCESFSDFLQNL